MSLSLNDGESDQNNDIRTLQVQLEVTQKVVLTLLQQLSEMKEQVNTNYVIIW